jgi:uncharacterized membrane protein SpoIIM required for sporulation
MVLESILNPLGKKRSGWRYFLIGIIFSIAAVLFSMWVFYNQTSIIMIALLVMLSVPLMYATLVREEEEDIYLPNEKSMLKQHSKTIGFLTLLFLGFVVGFTLLYLFLPGDTVTNVVFSAQHDAIYEVNNHVSGAAYSMGGFLGILDNNLRVLVFCVIFAFFFGAGAIFILSWNASVIAAAIGSFIREGMAKAAESLGFVGLSTYFQVIALGFMRYMTHGIFEIVAYFIAGLAGGILSINIMKHGIKNKYIYKIGYDAAILILLAVLVLVFAGLVEVFITPLLF